MKTMKQLQAALNTVNNTNDIKVVKEHSYYIIKQCSVKVMTIKGIC